MNKYISKCHGANWRVASSQGWGGGLGYLRTYTCNKCGYICDLKRKYKPRQPKPATKEEKDE